MPSIILKIKQPINTSLQSNVGDTIYFLRGDTVKKLGECIAITQDSDFFSITTSVGTRMETPDNGDFIFFGKNSVVGSSGVKGYYAEIEMKNNSTDGIELFSVTSNMSVSSK